MDKDTSEMSTMKETFLKNRNNKGLHVTGRYVQQTSLSLICESFLDSALMVVSYIMFRTALILNVV